MKKVRVVILRDSEYLDKNIENQIDKMIWTENRFFFFFYKRNILIIIEIIWTETDLFCIGRMAKNVWLENPN